MSIIPTYIVLHVDGVWIPKAYMQLCPISFLVSSKFWLGSLWIWRNTYLLTSRTKRSCLIIHFFLRKRIPTSITISIKHPEFEGFQSQNILVHTGRSKEGAVLLAPSRNCWNLNP